MLEARAYIEALLASPGFDVLVATPRHAMVLARTLSELPDLRGNVMHDVHTAVLMREHGISRICTRDTDFRRFPFLTVVDPLPAGEPGLQAGDFGVQGRLGRQCVNVKTSSVMLSTPYGLGRAGRGLQEEPMTRAFDKIAAGLDDARAYLQGERANFAVHEIEVPDPDVLAIRNKTGLSQPAFARSIGIPVGTLKNWEQGRRRPEGPARVLLALIDKRPSIVEEELGR